MLFVNFVAFSVLLIGEVLSGKGHTSAVYGRSKVFDDGKVCHRSEDKAIIISCMDGVKKSCYFKMAVSRSVSDYEYQESQCIKV